MKGTIEDPQLMASIGVAAAQTNAYNVDKLKEIVDQYKGEDGDSQGHFDERKGGRPRNEEKT